MSKGLTFSTFYTLSKAIDSQDNDNDGSGVAPLTNRGLEKARAGFDRTHRFIGYTTYELPFGKGKSFMSGGGWKQTLFGGYEIAWIQTVESGNPLTFDFAGSPNNYYPTYAGNRRPDLVSQPSLLPNWGNVGVIASIRRIATRLSPSITLLILRPLRPEIPDAIS